MIISFSDSWWTVMEVVTVKSHHRNSTWLLLFFDYYCFLIEHKLLRHTMWQLQKALGIVKINMAWDTAMNYKKWVAEFQNY